MKKFIVCAMMAVAFAFTANAQEPAKKSCCASQQAKTCTKGDSTAQKGNCPKATAKPACCKSEQSGEKKACCKSDSTAKKSCCTGEKVAKKAKKAKK